MYSKQVLLECVGGLHARPAAAFTACAKKFQSKVTVKNLDKPERKSVDAKSIMRVLAEGIPSGTRIELAAEGADEEEAIGALAALVESHFE